MSRQYIPDTSKEYLSFRDEITKRIRSAQYEALKAVNKEMIALYWEIGRRITEQQKTLGWGSLLWKTYPKIFKRSFRELKGLEFPTCGIWHGFMLNISQ